MLNDDTANGGEPGEQVSAVEASMKFVVGIVHPNGADGDLGGLGINQPQKRFGIGFGRVGIGQAGHNQIAGESLTAELVDDSKGAFEPIFEVGLIKDVTGEAQTNVVGVDGLEGVDSVDELAFGVKVMVGETQG